MKIVTIIVALVFAKFGPEMCGVIGQNPTVMESALWGGVFGGIGGVVGFFIGKLFGLGSD